MPHPLLHLLTTQPQLLGEHAQAYGELVTTEVSAAASQWKRRLLLGAVAVVLAAVALTLAGVALMLWAITPPAQISAPWALWLTPLVPAAAAVYCGLAAKSGDDQADFADLRTQLRADWELLRELSKPTP